MIAGSCTIALQSIKLRSCEMRTWHGPPENTQLLTKTCGPHYILRTTLWPHSSIHVSSATSGRGGMHAFVNTNRSGNFYPRDGQDVGLTLLQPHQLSHETAVGQSVRRVILAANCNAARAINTATACSATLCQNKKMLTAPCMVILS